MEIGSDWNVEKIPLAFKSQGDQFFSYIMKVIMKMLIDREDAGWPIGLIPGIYYEKVYSKSIYLTAYLSNLFRVPFDDFSIPTIREKIVFYKWNFQ